MQSHPPRLILLSRFCLGDRETIAGDDYGSRPTFAKATSDKGESHQSFAVIVARNRCRDVASSQSP